ncbi:hypothetical protein CC1G_14043 [Coprinopsis cinerea okayama7|uniref:Uncharacterized protein n=1 Tax=Coprinopsis cinerea (strain Okayama-7 / 130 / ATCC MYA-4618 / FGSC 9003) TaxID=240176 RepID=D6RL19_COPC7|nr:hypothetical protein CC1G_14043 [Coprinopsis cinerea okayama7\|eukprot:XP_002912005.1 hypothetical protein CC1G_14043 [Coprinopsis cinerea okayama7\
MNAVFRLLLKDDMKKRAENDGVLRVGTMSHNLSVSGIGPPPSLSAYRLRSQTKRLPLQQTANNPSGAHRTQEVGVRRQDGSGSGDSRFNNSIDDVESYSVDIVEGSYKDSREKPSSNSELDGTESGHDHASGDWDDDVNMDTTEAPGAVASNERSMQVAINDSGDIDISFGTESSMVTKSTTDVTKYTTDSDDHKLRWRTPDFSVFLHASPHFFPVLTCEIKPMVGVHIPAGDALFALPNFLQSPGGRITALGIINGARSQAEEQIRCVFSEFPELEKVVFVFVAGFLYVVQEVTYTRGISQDPIFPSQFTLTESDFLFDEEIIKSEGRFVPNDNLKKLWRTLLPQPHEKESL